MEKIKLLDSLTIKSKILLSGIIIGILPLTMLGVSTFTISNNVVIKAEKKNTEIVQNMLNNNLKTKTDLIQNIINNFSFDEALQDLVSKYNSYTDFYNCNTISYETKLILTKYVITNDAFFYCTLFSKDGRLISSDAPDQEFANQLNNQAEKIIKKNPYNSNQSEWIGLYRFNDKIDNEYNGFLIIKPFVKVNAGNIIGTLVFFVKEDFVNEAFNKIDGNGEYIIIDKNSNIISSTNKLNLYKNINTIISGISYKTVADSIVADDNKGSRILVSVTAVEDHNWKLIHLMPIKDVTASSSLIVNVFIFWGLFSILLAFIINFYLSRKILYPLENMVTTLKKIKNGDLTAYVCENTKDEIGELAKIFNATMSQINLLIDQLKLQRHINSTYEMKLMQEQLKPHFLYNTIESIVSLIHLKMYEKATEVALKLSSFYRLILNNGESLTSIHSEMKITENYLYLQKIRYIEYLEYKIEYDESLFDFQIPKMTIQPIVENAIYHGIRKIKTKGFIEVRVKQNSGNVIIEVHDNGVGMPEEKIKYLLKSKPNKGHEFGFFSVRERLYLLFGEDAKIEIDSELGKYCCVRIKLAIKATQKGSSNE